MHDYLDNVQVQFGNRQQHVPDNFSFEEPDTPILENSMQTLALNFSLAFLSFHIVEAFLGFRLFTVLLGAEDLALLVVDDGSHLAICRADESEETDEKDTDKHDNDLRVLLYVW